MIIPPLRWMPALLDMTTHLWAIGWSWWGVGSVPPPEATPTPGIAPVVPPVPPTNPPVATVTDHALLVLLGAYAQNLGRIDQPAQVPLAQRTYDHAPQEKLIQFLVGILGGIDYLQDFDAAAHPRTRDPLVAQAWGQTAFAHYSGVSRTLAAADAATLTALILQLRAITQPLVDAEVLALLRSDQPLWLDGHAGAPPAAAAAAAGDPGDPPAAGGPADRHAAPAADGAAAVARSVGDREHRADRPAAVGRARGCGLQDG